MNPEHNWFYVPPEHISKTHIVFPKKSAHHAAHVLRKKEHDTVYVTDGQGIFYKSRVVRAQGLSLKAEILEKEVMMPPTPPFIDCAFVPLKGSRTEYILEKGKELGMRAFIPFISRNAVMKHLSQKKIDRFTHIMISAMVQSQQCFVSPVDPCATIQSLIERFEQYDHVLIADPSGTDRVVLDGKTVLIVIGPEGGFERDENTIFTRAGAILFSLGPRRLRSETAAIAGIVKIQTLLSQ